MKWYRLLDDNPEYTATKMITDPSRGTKNAKEGSMSDII